MLSVRVKVNAGVMVIRVTRQITRVTVVHTTSNSLSRNKIILIFKRKSVTKQFVIVDFYTHYTNA